MRYLSLGVAGAVIALTLASCRADTAEEQPARPSQDVMRGAPLYQPAVLADQRGSAEAMEFVFRSPSPADSIAEWYRARITYMGWDISGDATTPDGAISLHAQREGAPLWIIIRSLGDDAGSEFSLIGAAPDTSTVSER